MLYFYTYGFHSSLNCDAYKRLCDGLKINPVQLEYANGGLFLDNIKWLKEQILNYLNANFKTDSKLSANFSNQKVINNETFEPKNYPPFCFIGNSQGAFYLSQLAAFSEIDKSFPKPRALFLFNPVRDAILQLTKYIGDNLNTTTNTHFDFSNAALQSYKNALNHAGNTKDSIARYVFIALQDELINAQDSIKYWQDSSEIFTFNSGHKIYDFSPFAKVLREFEKSVES